MLNLVILPMWVLSGVFFASSNFPAPFQPFIQALPLTALNDAMRAVMLEGAPARSVAGELALLGGWGAGSFTLALRLFRWMWRGGPSTYNDAVIAGPPAPDRGTQADQWTGARPLVSGRPVFIGVLVAGVAIAAVLLSLGRTPGLAATLSADYTAMMAGSLAPSVQDADPGTLAHALARGGLGFTPRIVSLEPEFSLLGGRPHTFAGRRAAAWFFRSPSVDSALAEAFDGRLDELGPPDDTRTDRGVTLHIYHKTTQTIACWQDGPLVYAFISTIPSERVIALARRHAVTP
jgi:hypothetical protein